MPKKKPDIFNTDNFFCFNNSKVSNLYNNDVIIHKIKKSRENSFARGRVYLIFLLGPGWLNELGSWITEQLIRAYHQYGVGSRPAL